MIKKAWILGVLVLTACVTVNVYFPAAAVQKAADEIVEDTWGNQPQASLHTEPAQKRGFPRTHVWLALVSDAHAQQANINVSNPAIRSIKDQMRQRSGQLKPFLSQKNVGIDKKGYLKVLNTKGLALKDRSRVNQLVTAENRDRKALYGEIANANNLKGDSNKIAGIFANTWREKAQSGWQIQKNDGTWTTK